MQLTSILWVMKYRRLWWVGHEATVVMGDFIEEINCETQEEGKRVR